MSISWTRRRISEILAGTLLIAISSGWLPLDLSAADKPTAKGTAASKSKTKPAETVEEPDAGGDAAPDVDEDLTALIVPAELLGKVEKSGRLQFSQALRGLLLEGIALDGAAAAKKYYETAHRAVASDPRAAYAFGLAFLEQKNTKEALSQFQAAAKHTSGMYLPALQAGAWVHLVRNEFGPAHASLVDLARRIEDTKSSWPTERDRNHTAEWLGRTIGFLTGPGASADRETQVAETAAIIEKTLTAERTLAYEQGRKGIARRHKELQALAARPVADVVSEMNAKRQAARTAVQAAQAEIKRIEDEIRDARKPYEQQIADANLEIRSSGQKASRAAKEIPDAEEKVEIYSVPQVMANGVRTYRGVPTSVRTRNENNQEKKARETQLASARQHLQQLKTSVESAKQSMADARKNRDKAQADQRAAVAAKQPELREARKKSQEAGAHLRDVEHAALSPEQIKTRVTAFEAYVPLDPFAEKDRLLATLKAD